MLTRLPSDIIKLVLLPFLLDHDALPGLINLSKALRVYRQGYVSQSYYNIEIRGSVTDVVFTKAFGFHRDLNKIYDQNPSLYTTYFSKITHMQISLSSCGGPDKNIVPEGIEVLEIGSVCHFNMNQLPSSLHTLISGTYDFINGQSQSIETFICRNDFTYFDIEKVFPNLKHLVIYGIPNFLHMIKNIPKITLYDWSDLCFIPEGTIEVSVDGWLKDVSIYDEIPNLPSETKTLYINGERIDLEAINKKFDEIGLDEMLLNDNLDVFFK